MVACGQCGASLAAVAVTAHEERQVFDIPAIRIEVTAHRIEVKTCPGCGAENRGVFPVGVTGFVQYGPGVKTWATYFQTQHFVPVERTAQIIKDLVGHRVAEATLMKALGSARQRLRRRRQQSKTSSGTRRWCASMSPACALRGNCSGCMWPLPRT